MAKTNLKTLPNNAICKCHKVFARPYLIEKDNEPDIIKYTCVITGQKCEVSNETI